MGYIHWGSAYIVHPMSYRYQQTHSAWTRIVVETGDYIIDPGGRIDHPEAARKDRTRRLRG